MAKPVGFDQKIQLNHLHLTANELRFTEKKAMYQKLNEDLAGDIPGAKSRKNAITMLMKIWCPREPAHTELRDRALSLYPEASQEEKLLLHWGLTLLAYPFFQSVAEEMGNLLRLQREVPSQQLGRRMKLLYGDRRRVEVALSAVLGSMKAWGVIRWAPKHIYTLPGKVEVKSVLLKNWITELIFRVSEFRVMPLEVLNAQALMFPFDCSVQLAELDSQRLIIDRQGLDTYMIRLAT